MKNITIILKCNIDLFSKNINEITDEADKEKIHVYQTYYNFINNNNSINTIELIFNEIYNNKIVSEKDSLNISIIIFKSFIENKIVDEIAESYILSDKILNYVCNQYKYYLISTKTYMAKKSIYTICLHIIDILVNSNIINQKKINIYIKPNIKTIKYYNLNTNDYLKSVNEYMTFSYKNYEIVEYYNDYFITSIHYSKTIELYKENYYSNKKFNLKNINYIMNKINIKIYIDKDYQNLLKNKLSTDIDDTKKKIKYNIILLNKLFENENWNINIKNQISLLQSQNSKMLDLLIYSYFSNYDFNDNYIFFPIFLDFRGRKYYHSKIGPTSSKILRPSFYYGWYDSNDFNEKNNIFSLKYYDIINNFCQEKKIINDKKFYESYFWLLIAIGKFYIDKNKYPIKTEEFLNLAIKNYDNDNIIEIADWLEINHYKNILNQMNGNKIKKRIIIKDATASLNQILMKKLGPIDQYSLDYVNLGEEWEWYDTYIITRDLFYDYIKNDKNFEKYQDKEIFNSVLPRSLIKNMIMIIPYSAGDELCYENYKKTIIEKNIDIEVDSSLKKLLKKFFNFIRNDIQEFYLYNKTSTSLVNKMSEDFENIRKYVLESDTGEADLSYFKMKRSSIDKKYKVAGVNKRVTKLILTPSNAIDKKAFETAIGANTVHFLDADEIRIIESVLGFSLITIHDSYLIDFNNCSKLIIAKINHYQKEINKNMIGYKVNNIFILI